MMGRIKKVGAELLFTAIMDGNVHDAIAMLNDGEVDVNAKNHNGQTPLHFAVDTKNKAMIEILLRYGANPQIQENIDVGHNTPMHLAVERNMLECMQLFSQCEPDLSIANSNGFTVLHIAAREGLLEMCELLLELGIDADIPDKYGFSAAYWSKEKKHKAIMDLLPNPVK